MRKRGSCDPASSGFRTAEVGGVQISGVKHQTFRGAEVQMHDRPFAACSVTTHLVSYQGGRPRRSPVNGAEGRDVGIVRLFLLHGRKVLSSRRNRVAERLAAFEIKGEVKMRLST